MGVGSGIAAQTVPWIGRLEAIARALAIRPPPNRVADVSLASGLVDTKITCFA